MDLACAADFDVLEWDPDRLVSTAVNVRYNLTSSFPHNFLRQNSQIIKCWIISLAETSYSHPPMLCDSIFCFLLQLLIGISIAADTLQVIITYVLVPIVVMRYG